jgi:ComF family protein
MAPLAGPMCGVCGEGLGQLNPWDKLGLCGVCQEDLPPYKKAAAYGAYDGRLRELIHLLKYDQVHPAASVLGRMLAKASDKLELAGPAVVVPVPLHSSKRRQRRFNQAELIAQVALRSVLRSVSRSGAKSSVTKPRTQGDLQLESGILERVRATAPQIGLTRPQRQENIRGAFRVAHPNKLSGRDVLLLDDVMTTGTTAAECARVLLRAGAKNVWVATVARTLKHTSPGISLDGSDGAAAIGK